MEYGGMDAIGFHSIPSNFLISKQWNTISIHSIPFHSTLYHQSKHTLTKPFPRDNKYSRQGHRQWFDLRMTEMNYGRLISGGRRLLRLMCTEATISERPAKKPNLYQSLSKLEKTGSSVSQTLNQYIMEGKAIGKRELESCVQEVRQYRRFHYTLELMESEQMRKIKFSWDNYAVHSDLESRGKGFVTAENYFNGLPPPGKNKYTYGALLSCYCKELMTDKALAHFDKMDELGYLTTLSFTNLMGLYMRLGQPQKVHQLVTDMKQREMSMTAFTYIVWINSYASLNDIAGVERVYKEMTEEDEDKIYWKTYSKLAAIYVKAEQFEKAELMLRKLEQVMKPRQHNAYHCLLTLYAGTGNLKEAYRVWKCLKSISPVTNKSYLVMLSMLQRLNDTKGVIKCFKEWESRCNSYHISLTTVAMSAFLRQDMGEEAASVFKDAIRRCKGPFFKIREMFMVYFLEKGQLNGALSHLEAAFTDDNWRPTPQVVSAFLKYYEEETDLDGVDELCKILKTHNLDESWLKTCITASESSPEIHPTLKEDSYDNDVDEMLV